MSEQQTISACPHPEAVGTRWGDPISEERQAELQGYLDRWAAEADHGERNGPFDFTGRDIAERDLLWLTGGDVSWLADRVRDAHAWVPDLHLEGVDLGKRHLEGAKLPGAHLEGASLYGAHMERASLRESRLEGASLSEAHLAGANLGGAHLESAFLNLARMEGADLDKAHLEDTFLDQAHLEGATLREAHLEKARLRSAHLEGTSLYRAHMEGVLLAGARFDADTYLTNVQLGPGMSRDWLDTMRLRNSNAALGDIKWRDADLTGVPWEQLRRLGDERDAGYFASADDHRKVVRAYRQVAARLRDQGMADAADRFAYRAQIRERGVLLRTLRLPQYLFSWVLAILAGYGFRPGRALFWYLVTIVGFTVLYMQATTGWVPLGLPAPSQLAPLPWYEALILSVSSFHGRGFFQPLESLGDPVAALAAVEAVVGLFIEITFIATFTQRFFAR